MSEAVSCGVMPERDEELRRQGWTRQFLADEPRLSEAVAEYRDIGFEVHLEPFDPKGKGEDGCTTCFDDPAVAARFKTIYTRPAKEMGEDLF